MRPEKPKAIFFDWDGTLVDTIPGLRMAHNHVRTTMGFEPWTEAEFWENLHYSSRELYPRIYGDRAGEAVAILTDFFDKHALKYLSPLAGAESLLKAIAKTGMKTGLVSNKRHEFLLRDVRHLGWEKYFPVAVGAGYAAKDKPAGDPVLKAFELAGTDKADLPSCWYVGDSETDLLAAKNAGCKAALVLYGKDKSDLVEKYNPALVARDCEEIEAFLAA